MIAVEFEALWEQREQSVDGRCTAVVALPLIGLMGSKEIVGKALLDALETLQVSSLQLFKEAFGQRGTAEVEAHVGQIDTG